MLIREELRISLVEKIKQRKLIIFVGAGVSMHIGQPSWNRLVAEAAEKAGYEPKVFMTLGDNLGLMEYFRNANGASDYSMFADAMRRDWDTSEIRSRIKSSKIYQMIVGLGVDEFYTTNYDHNLEIAWELIKGRVTNRIVRASDFLKCNHSQPTIIKFHGDYEDHKTMVLGESDYFERLDFEDPLDVKLKADLMTKSVLYLGYSLRDINLRYLTFKVDKFFEGADIQTRNSSRSFIFLNRPNTVEEQILKKRGIDLIVSDEHRPEEALLEFLESLSSALK